MTPTAPLDRSKPTTGQLDHLWFPVGPVLAELRKSGLSLANIALLKVLLLHARGIEEKSTDLLHDYPYAVDYWWGRPSVDRLADDLAVDRGTVRRGLNRLCDLGHIAQRDDADGLLAKHGGLLICCEFLCLDSEFNIRVPLRSSLAALKKRLGARRLETVLVYELIVGKASLSERNPHAWCLQAQASLAALLGMTRRAFVEIVGRLRDRGLVHTAGCQHRLRPGPSPMVHNPLTLEGNLGKLEGVQGSPVTGEVRRNPLTPWCVTHSPHDAEPTHPMVHNPLTLDEPERNHKKNQQTYTPNPPQKVSPMDQCIRSATQGRLTSRSEAKGMTLEEASRYRSELRVALLKAGASDQDIEAMLSEARSMQDPVPEAGVPVAVGAT